MSADRGQGVTRFLAALCMTLVLAACGGYKSSSSVGERLLIADQFNNRVIEVDTAGNILWHFGNGPSDLTASSIIGVNDAQTVGDDLVLMAGTGCASGHRTGLPERLCR